MKQTMLMTTEHLDLIMEHYHHFKQYKQFEGIIAIEDGIIIINDGVDAIYFWFEGKHRDAY